MVTGIVGEKDVGIVEDVGKVEEEVVEMDVEEDAKVNVADGVVENEGAVEEVEETICLNRKREAVVGAIVGVVVDLVVGTVVSAVVSLDDGADDAIIMMGLMVRLVSGMS